MNTTTDTTTTSAAAPDVDTASTNPPTVRPDPGSILDMIARRSVAALATTSPAGHSHSAIVRYALADDALWISTMTDSRKARNVDADGRVGVVIPVRRLPVGPPSAIQFQTRGEVVTLDDTTLRRLADERAIRSVTGHGEFDLPGGCFLRIGLPRRMTTYGLGMSLWQLIRHPLDAAGIVELSPPDRVREGQLRGDGAS